MTELCSLCRLPVNERFGLYTTIDVDKNVTFFVHATCVALLIGRESHDTR